MTEQSSPIQSDTEDQDAIDDAADAGDVPDEEVVIVNRLSQEITASVDHGNGPEAVKIPPHGSSAPVKRAAVTAHTHNLVGKGHLRLRKKAN